MYIDLLRFENLERKEQIESIEEVLKSNGFIVVKREGHKKTTKNYIYYRADVDVIFVVIEKSEGKGVGLHYTLIDKSTYYEILENHPKRVLNVTERNDGKYKIIYSEKKKGYYTNISLHRKVIHCEGKCVDHISHNPYINTSEMLRACTVQENNRNRKFYKQLTLRKVIGLNNVVFEEELIEKLVEHRDLVCSGNASIHCFETELEMFKVINEQVGMSLCEFIYNPTLDFSKTFYVYVLYRCKCLPDFSWDDVLNYNNSYHMRYNINSEELLFDLQNDYS